MADKFNHNNTETELKRDLGFGGAVSIVIGVVIGSGIFFKPSIVFHDAGAPGLGLLAWFTGGIITLAAGLTIAEIASAIPKTGGLYTYLDELYGSRWAFLLGWVQTVIYYPGAIAALAIVFGNQLNFFIPISPVIQKLVAIAVMFFLILMNIIATKYGGYIQTIATIGKLLPIAALIILGLLNGSQHDYSPFLPSTSGIAANFGVAILGTLWAYDGWISVGNVAGEIKNPSKNLPRAIILGLSFVIIVYVLVNIAMLNVIPFNLITGTKEPASETALRLLGRSGGGLITAGILVSIFGALNGYILTGGRVPLAMAERKLLPFSSAFSKLHVSHNTPSNALLLEGVLAVLYIISGTFNTLTDLVVFVLWIFFIMSLFGVFILRKKLPDKDRPFKVPLYPFVPAVAILGGVYIVLSTLVKQTTNSLTGILVTLTGFPVYYLIKHNNKS